MNIRFQTQNFFVIVTHVESNGIKTTKNHVMTPIAIARVSHKASLKTYLFNEYVGYITSAPSFPIGSINSEEQTAGQIHSGSHSQIGS